MTATTTGPNLTAAKLAIERLMDDECVITRDLVGRENAGLDVATGRIIDQAPDVVYFGRCKIKEGETASRWSAETRGGESVRQITATGGIPLDLAELRDGDLLTVLASRRDGKLVGRQYQVGDVVAGTFQVQCKFTLVFLRAVAEVPGFGPVNIPVVGPPSVVIGGPPGAQGPVGPVATSATIEILVTDPLGSALLVGDGQAYYRVPARISGWSLSAVAMALDTPSSAGLPTVQFRRNRSGAEVDMLLTGVSIDVGETDSITAATPALIDTANDDVVVGDRIYIDVDVAGTGAKGLLVEFSFSL